MTGRPSKITVLLLVFISTVPLITMGYLTIMAPVKLIKQPKIKPCNCLPCSEWQTLSTKRDMLIDNRKRSTRDNLRLDSINSALGIDETLDNIPER